MVSKRVDTANMNVILSPHCRNAFMNAPAWVWGGKRQDHTKQGLPRLGGAWHGNLENLLETSFKKILIQTSGTYPRRTDMWCQFVIPLWCLFLNLMHWREWITEGKQFCITFIVRYSATLLPFLDIKCWRSSALTFSLHERSSFYQNERCWLNLMATFAIKPCKID